MGRPDLLPEAQVRRPFYAPSDLLHRTTDVPGTWEYEQKKATYGSCVGVSDAVRAKSRDLSGHICAFISAYCRAFCSSGCQFLHVQQCSGTHPCHNHLWERYLPAEEVFGCVLTELLHLQTIDARIGTLNPRGLPNPSAYLTRATARTLLLPHQIHLPAKAPLVP